MVFLNRTRNICYLWQVKHQMKITQIVDLQSFNFFLNRNLNLLLKYVLGVINNILLQIV